jgi:hypothetical protein
MTAVASQAGSSYGRPSPLRRLTMQRTSLVAGSAIVATVLAVGLFGDTPTQSAAIAAMFALGLVIHVASGVVPVSRVLLIGSLHVLAALALALSIGS